MHIARLPLTSAFLAVLLFGAIASGCGGGDDGDDPTSTAGGGGDNGGSGATGDGPIAVSLAVDAGPHDEGETIEVTVRLENVSSSAVTVLRPYLVPSPVIFIVTNADGIEHGYQGVFGERRLLTADRFEELSPGDSTEQTFDLTDGYRLPPGEYEVIASYRNTDVGADHGFSAFLTGGNDFSSAPVTIEVQ